MLGGGREVGGSEVFSKQEVNRTLPIIINLQCVKGLLLCIGVDIA